MKSLEMKNAMRLALFTSNLHRQELLFQSSGEVPMPPKKADFIKVSARLTHGAAAAR